MYSWRRKPWFLICKDSVKRILLVDLNIISNSSFSLLAVSLLSGSKGWFCGLMILVNSPDFYCGAKATRSSPPLLNRVGHFHSHPVVCMPSIFYCNFFCWFNGPFCWFSSFFPLSKMVLCKHVVSCVFQKRLCYYDYSVWWSCESGRRVLLVEMVSGSLTTDPHQIRSVGSSTGLTSVSSMTVPLLLRLA